jgi:hypothetical protein
MKRLDLAAAAYLIGVLIAALILIFAYKPN